MHTLFKTDWREIWGDLPVPESGTVYTRPEIVSLILDLAGYEAKRNDLLDVKLMEPSCGEGSFLGEIVGRLAASAHRGKDRVRWSDARWDAAITAVDIDADAVDGSRELISSLLSDHGCPFPRATQLAERWAFRTDFLLHEWGRNTFDIVVGNPPYVRLEAMPATILREYRDAWRTATDRADLYIPFIECGLSLLGAHGTLAFICANRFAKNQYGAGIRRLIAQRYHVKHYINLEHTQPFLDDVSAYPAIIVIDRQRGSPTDAVTISDLEFPTLNSVRHGARQDERERIFESWYPDGAPWISTSRTRHASMQSLARNFPTIEESAPGTKIGIGIATGADDIFVLPCKQPAIEDSRQAPLLMAGDISNTAVNWSGHYLVNPFASTHDGALVDLCDFPGLAAHFKEHASRLKSRHCAKGRPNAWYRTIDRFWPALTTTPKLVIPDIQPGGVIGYDEGRYYPHHNVYWITSTTWDLRALQAILQSDFVTDQLRALSVAMRGGSLRYQAQNLRRVRIPSPFASGRSV